MILVDTSIWIDHLRSGSPALAALLQNEAVCTHDFVIGELACGNLRNRAEVLGLLQSLPRLSAATEDETLFFIEQQHLMGRGIGYVDTHLLAAAVIRNIPIWTKDKHLMAIAEEKAWAHAPGAH
ncbi:type II toxin-antitoxin system VapC family toxin [Sulfuritalea sp.]|uniref:type II toxin-antitoxin system VapC family toxin n=1 Tax=Sulfuritalea sp. TaxID=2480090 RepID=UPI00286EACE1|nr:type II toxin-antitoxin system VapC family toxin [Sulfuritalea sp.]